VNGAAWCEVDAPAKVNLFLEVLARRSDGFHELETVMLAIDLRDRVRARRTQDGRVRCALSGPQASGDIPADERNLAVRAAQAALALARSAGAAGERDGLELELDKHIPSQAGLGGASSDAAAAFAAVEGALGWSAQPTPAASALAALGSDCVFFRRAATSGLALCRGRGELVTPLPPPPSGAALVVITPDVGAPTARVYAHLAEPLSWSESTRSLPQCFNSETCAASPWRERIECFNRLEDAACAAVPPLGRWRTALGQGLSEKFCLSGSGASFFALCSSVSSARAVLSGALAALDGAGLRPRGAWLVRPFRRP